MADDQSRIDLAQKVVLLENENAKLREQLNRFAAVVGALSLEGAKARVVADIAKEMANEHP